MSPEGVQWSSESAVLSCSRDGWDLGDKERRREGDRVSLLMGMCIRSGTSGWQLFKPAALSPEPGPAERPAGQSLGLLMHYWSLGRYLTCLLGYSSARASKGHYDPLLTIPSQLSESGVVVLMLPHSPEMGMAHLGGMRLKEAISGSGCECFMQATQQRSGPTCPSGPQGLRHTRGSWELGAWVRKTGKLLPEQKPGRMLQPIGSTTEPSGKKEAEWRPYPNGCL